MFCVYTITDIETEEIVYIGSTTNFERRRYEHARRFPWVKYDMDIVYECDTREEMFRLEAELISQHKPRKNVVHVPGRSHTSVAGLYKKAIREGREAFQTALVEQGGTTHPQ